MKFGCLFGIFLDSANLICRSTDISKCYRGSLRLQDNKSLLYLQIFQDGDDMTDMGDGTDADEWMNVSIRSANHKSQSLCLQN